MANASVDDFLQAFGEQFLSYLLNVSSEELRRRASEPDCRLAEDREAVLAELGELFNYLKNLENWNGLESHHLSRLFGKFSPDSSTTVVNEIRESVGGEVWQPEHEDPLRNTLAFLVRDFSPLVLLPSSIGSIDTTWHTTVGFYEHPLRSKFEEYVLGDPDLKKLFPEKSEHGGPSGAAYTSAGRGGSLQLWTFAQGLFSSGWHLAQLYSATPEVSEHAAAAVESMAKIIAALQRKPASIPVRVGLSGCLLPDSVDEVDLGWAKLRPLDQRDRNIHVVSEMDGLLTRRSKDGGSIAINYAGDLVLETEIEYKINVTNVDPMTSWPAGFNPSSLIERKLENLKLGLLLSVEQEPLVNLATRWTVMVDPLHFSRVLGWNEIRPEKLHPFQHTDNSLDHWKRWAILVSERRGSSIDVAIRRVLLSSAERNMPEDVLLDAIMVWENLFGARQETVTRVTGSLAWLLSEGSEDRKSKLRHFKKLYGLRSTIVHGGQPKQDELRDSPSKALQGSLAALRVLFRDRSDLLAEKSSEDRSNRLLLGD